MAGPGPRGSGALTYLTSFQSPQVSLFTFDPHSAEERKLSHRKVNLTGLKTTMGMWPGWGLCPEPSDTAPCLHLLYLTTQTLGILASGKSSAP